MNIILIIAGAGLILAAGFILKDRKNQAGRNARYRAPRPILKLERSALGRAGGGTGKRAPLFARTRPASPAAPILLGGVLMVLCLWLAAAYLRPSADSAERGTMGTAPPPQPPPQVGALAGRLSVPEPPAAPTAAPPAPAEPARTAALAQAAAGQTGGSALSQIGLMPTRKPASAAPTPKPAPPPRPAPPPAAGEARAEAVASTPRPALPSQPASADSNLVRVLADPQPSVRPPAPPEAVRPGILSDTAGFTVHLGSFVDQANAEKFRAKLSAAGEAAAISEIDMDGRRWYRVLSGRFNTRAAADAHGRDLRRRGLIDDTGPFIVKPINSGN